jgi:hypothetical protein
MRAAGRVGEFMGGTRAAQSVCGQASRVALRRSLTLPLTPVAHSTRYTLVAHATAHAHGGR